MLSFERDFFGCSGISLLLFSSALLKLAFLDTQRFWLAIKMQFQFCYGIFLLILVFTTTKLIKIMKRLSINIFCWKISTLQGWYFLFSYKGLNIVVIGASVADFPNNSG